MPLRVPRVRGFESKDDDDDAADIMDMLLIWKWFLFDIHGGSFLYLSFIFTEGGCWPIELFTTIC